ncbi:ATP synthase subunit gamma, mitochondrial-like [Gigantopelta aegis]|uniref:ATP synthase subunit gamma, mitochondrial-like n=1 Tax=Gigantopelta aegis TaxID=1735272 RepID=UPI001B88D71F|nr:ATP synthase subunit gamma, mitochondrial-like [Gigantopelta aegis]
MEALLVRSVQVITPQCTQVRGMATIKYIRMRLKSVTNIQKITKSMKMVSAAKFSRAERELKVARPFGIGAQAFYEKVEVKQDETQPSHLYIALTSDRGLCGGVHSSIAKRIRALLLEDKAGAETKLVCIGDKSKNILQRLFKPNILLTFNDIGKRPPVFADAAVVAAAIIESGFKYDVGKLFFNKFKSIVSYKTTEMPLFTLESVNSADKLSLYDSLDDDVMRSYNEFALVSLLFYAMKEGATTEQSQRMTSMDGATKNAGEMIDKLRMAFNRTRQAVITRELIEIISGAAAL